MKRKYRMAVVSIIIAVCAVYALLWLSSRRQYSVLYGISFNNEHAASLGLDWKAVYRAMLDEIRPEFIRLSATWLGFEKERGVYTMTDVDWQMAEAAKRGVKVMLVIGQKAPRWPECHVPQWALSLSPQEYEEELLNYVRHTVERYRDHPALELWQVENEPFIRFRFGECGGFRKDVVEKEIALVYEHDPLHRIMVTDSGELSTWRRASQAGDIFGTTLYRVVRTPRGRIFTYDWLPPAFYRFKAMLWGRRQSDVYVSELQAEPWFTDSTPLDTPVSRQEETMNPKRLSEHFLYAERIGFSRAYLWGVEWWYWMKETQGDARYWELVKEKLRG